MLTTPSELFETNLLGDLADDETYIELCKIADIERYEQRAQENVQMYACTCGFECYVDFTIIVHIVT